MKIPRLRHVSWLGALAVACASLLLAGCGAGSASASTATATATCPATNPLAQFKQVAGTITAVSSTQLTVQTLQGAPTTLALTSNTRYSRQQKAAQSDVQDGKIVQVIVKQNTDGSYTALTIVIRPAGQGAGFGGGGNGGNGGNGGTGGNGGNGGNGANPNCRPARGGNGGNGGTGGAGGNGGNGTLPNGARAITGTVATVTTQSVTVSERSGTDLTIKLDSSTVYSTIAQAQASDLQTGQIVTATARQQKDGTFTAVMVAILLGLPTGQ